MPDQDKVYIERADGRNRIEVRFAFDRQKVAQVKAIPGARWVAKEKFWAVPLTMRTCHELRSVFGQQLHIGPNLGSWARKNKKLEQRMWNLAKADDAELSQVPSDTASSLRPYQRAGIKFCSESPAPLIADQMGLGKTIQVLCSIIESGHLSGDHLIITPKIAVETGVWSRDMAKFDVPGEVFEAVGDRKKRDKIIDEFRESTAETKWLVVNPAMIRVKREKVVDEDGLPVTDKTGKQKTRIIATYDQIHEHSWQTVVLDECHKDGTRNPSTLTAEGAKRLKANKKFAMSGTPMTNRPIDLWGTLHFLDQDLFSSKWAWAEQWLEIKDNGFGKEIGNIRPGLEEEMFKSLSPFILRRTKAEVATDMPPKNHIKMWSSMSPEQERIYRDFAKNAEIKLNDSTLSATNVLSELTRLKQFAVAPQDIVGETDEGTLILQPRFEDSGKRETLEQMLEELGLIEFSKSYKAVPFYGDQEKVVLFSQFSKIVENVAEWLGSMGLSVETITGDTSSKNRKRIVDGFQNSDIQIVAMNTNAGGTAITLDRASNVVFLDETWSPADQEQAEDRCHRLSRMHTVNVYQIRSLETIEETIMERVENKSNIHKFILDKRREMKLW